MNTGRYIENYTIDKEMVNKQLNNAETIFVSIDEKKRFSQIELITSTLKIKDVLHIWNKKNKKINTIESINTLYELIIQCLLPYYLGINTYYYNDCICKRDITIEISMQNELIFIYKNKKYKLNGLDENMALTKMENKNNFSRFVIIKNKKSVVRENFERQTKDLVLIKTTK